MVGYAEGCPLPSRLCPSPKDEIFLLKRRILVHFERADVEIAVM